MKDSHSSTVARFLKGTHVVINARNEVSNFCLLRVLHLLLIIIQYKGDVNPALILKSVEAASGSRYTAHKEQPRKFEPIAPVGTNYTPIGRVDLNELRRSTPPITAAKPVHSPYLYLMFNCMCCTKSDSGLLESAYSGVTEPASYTPEGTS